MKVKINFTKPPFFSMYGGLRCADLVCIQSGKISFDDNAGILVSYTISKTSCPYNKENTFLIPKPDDKFFFNYLKNIIHFNKGFTSPLM